MKLECKYTDDLVRIAEGCNCIILSTIRKDGKHGSYGAIERSIIYDILVKAGRLSDLRPFLPFWNWDNSGERKDWSNAWWERVKQELGEEEPMKTRIAGELALDEIDSSRRLRVIQVDIGGKELLVVSLHKDSKIVSEIMLDGDTLKPVEY
jgi:hypothetical protein